MTAPERIKRYSVSNPFGSDGEEPDDAGEWVKWKDYAALSAKCEALEGDVERVINAAVGLADGRDEAAFIERTLRAARNQEEK